MKASPEERLDSWLSCRSAETQHLEFKQAVVLGNPKQKVEVLKDLTGMGNGGGGTVVYGVAEEKTPTGESVASHVVELTDPEVLTALKGIVDSGVRPTLRVQWSRADRPDKAAARRPPTESRAAGGSPPTIRPGRNGSVPPA